MEYPPVGLPTSAVSGGPPPPPPPQRVSASLYVGDLPVDLPQPEDALFALFNKVGMVLSIKVCRDMTTQRSLGYAYINFQSPSDAERAMETLNCAEIVPNAPIRIMWSTRDPTLRKSGSNNLFVKNLDVAMTVRQLHDAFSPMGAILSCKIAKDHTGKSRGYGFVHFEREECAREAIQQLNGKVIPGNGNEPLTVVPFVKKSDREAEAAKTFVSLYVKNISSEATEQMVKSAFEDASGAAVTSLFLSAHPQHKTKFALITMSTHEGALKAIEKLHDTATALAETDHKLFVCRALKKQDRQKPDRHSQSLYQSQGRNIYVKHLDDHVTKETFEELFAPFGKITSSALMHDTNGNFRGFGFVCFETKEAAAAAIRDMNGKMMNFRRPLYVSQAQQRDMRHQVLDEQRKSLLASQQRVSMQMQMYSAPQQWGRFPLPPPGPNPFMPPFVVGGLPAMGGASNMMRRPPPPQRMALPNAPRGVAMNVRAPMNMLNQPRGYTQPPPQQPRTNLPGGISAQQLAKMNPDEQKNALGERLYAKINEVNPSQAAKITGMLLEMETGEILNVLEDHRTLLAKVSEAVAVLAQHEVSPH